MTGGEMRADGQQPGKLGDFGAVPLAQTRASSGARFVVGRRFFFRRRQVVRGVGGESGARGRIETRLVAANARDPLGAPNGS